VLLKKQQQLRQNNNMLIISSLINGLIEQVFDIEHLLFACGQEGAGYQKKSISYLWTI